MAATLAEMMIFAPEFAKQVLANAKAFAKALDKEGFDVVAKKKGYTESHMVVFDVSGLGGGDHVATLFEQGNIMCSAYKLWRADEPLHGIRVGVTEVTRLGMKEPEMARIAQFMQRLAIDEEPPPKVANEVGDFRGQYLQAHFCL